MPETNRFRDDTFVGIVFGVAFVALALLGFVPNPLIGLEAYFASNPAHNILHGLVGLALVAGALTDNGKTTLLVFGIIYVVVALAGYIVGAHLMFGTVLVNFADHYLHLGMGLALFTAGLYVDNGE